MCGSLLTKRFFGQRISGRRGLGVHRERFFCILPSTGICDGADIFPRLENAMNGNSRPFMSMRGSCPRNGGDLRNGFPFSFPSMLSRRAMLNTSALGFGGLALSALVQDNPSAAAADSPGKRNSFAPRTHFEPRAKSVIMLMQNGGPSQMDLFDPKPELTKRAGQTLNVETFQQGNSRQINGLSAGISKVRRKWDRDVDAVADTRCDGRRLLPGSVDVFRA